MKTTQTLTMITAMIAATAAGPMIIHAAPIDAPQPAENSPSPVAKKTTKHLKLCAQLGLKVGQTYEFMIFNNEEVHYWTILSLGAKGWIQVKDSRYPETWLNLSQVIAVTPVRVSTAVERPKKPNRLR